MKKGAGIIVVGAGSMAEAFIRGVTKGGIVPPELIKVKNRSCRQHLERLVSTYGIEPADSYADAEDTTLVVLAVKPADVEEALMSTRSYLHGQLLISFAAGVSIAQLEEYVGHRALAVRTMPNLPVSVSAGTTAVSFSQGVSWEDRQVILRLLQQLGHAEEIPEDLMDAATAFSGSGPGFICYFLEAMEAAASSLGFSPEAARKMLLQTLVGTARTLEEWKLSPRELRQRVTSPGGTTFAGVQVLEAGDVGHTIGKAIVAAKARSAEMKSVRSTLS